MKKWIEKLKSREIKKEHYFMLLLFGILLFVIALPTKKSVTNSTGLLSEDTERMETKETADDGQKLKEAERYAAQMEDRLEEILKNTSGVGEAEVMITVKTTEEKVVEKDREVQDNRVEEEDGAGGRRINTDVTRAENTIFTENDVSPFIIRQDMPELEGILVICTGGDNPVLKSEITEAILALFAVDAHKIRIMKMK